MKPTNLRLHSNASRLTSRACGQTWGALMIMTSPQPCNSPSPNNVCAKWRGQRGLVLPVA